MSIANKLITIAENEQKVYIAGQKSMVDESKIIEATATGENILVLDDVSEIPHDVTVTVKSKNLLLSPFGTIDVENGKTYTFSFKLKENVTLPADAHYYFCWYTKDGFWNNQSLIQEGVVEYTECLFTAGYDENHDYYIDYGNMTEDMFEYVQLEEGDRATPYSPFVGKNIFYVNATRKVNSNGIECDLTEGKSSFIFNGTTTKDTSFNISVFTLKAGTYTVSVFGTNTITSDMDRFFLRYTDASGTNTTVNNIMAGVPKTFTLSSDSSVRIDAVIASNSTYSNKEICVQIEKGSVATEYEPFINPMGGSRNLFDMSQSEYYTKQEDGSYVNNSRLSSANRTPLTLPYGSYVLSYDLKAPVDCNARITIVLKDGTNINSYVTTTGDYVHAETKFTGEPIEWYMDYKTAVAESGDFYKVFVKEIQLEKGTAATPYVPYASVISQVKLRVSSKNLFDIATAPELYYHDYTLEKTDTGFIATSTAQGETLSTRHGFNIGRYEDLVGKTFTVSANYSSPTNTDGSPYILVVNTSIQSADNYEFNNTNRQQIAGKKNTSLTFTISEGLPFDYVCVLFYLSSDKPIKVGDKFEYSNIQIEEGTTASLYEPYVEPITLSLDDEGKATTKSMSPNMIFTSNAGGVLITADYHKSYGMQTERDKVWDAIQNYGNRTAYSTGFGYSAWDDRTFRPKYDIRPVGGCGDLFRESKIVDLEGVLQRCGVVLDTSQVTSLNYAFYNSLIKNIPTLNMTRMSSAAAGRLYVGQYTTTIRKIITAETTPWDSLTFRHAKNLENLIIEGTIGQNGFDVQVSTKLSRDSIMSIVNALSTTTSGLTVTLSRTAVNKAFETSASAGDGSTSTEWLELIAAKSNWTISLV